MPAIRCHPGRTQVSTRPFVYDALALQFQNMRKRGHYAEKRAQEKKQVGERFLRMKQTRTGPIV